MTGKERVRDTTSSPPAGGLPSSVSGERHQTASICYLQSTYLTHLEITDKSGNVSYLHN